MTPLKRTEALYEETAAEVTKLTGARASFRAPLYQRWFRDYFLVHPDVRLDYQAIGSGAGIENFIGGRLDFTGSDLPLTEEQAARRILQHIGARA